MCHWSDHTLSCLSKPDRQNRQRFGKVIAGQRISVKSVNRQNRQNRQRFGKVIWDGGDVCHSSGHQEGFLRRVPMSI